jgi:Tol biopolymer transport system component
MPLAPGTRLGAYEILSLLGEGGMGQVFRARDTKLGRDVAIKVLPREFQSDQDRLRRLTNEARAASALNHPNILTVYGVDESDAGPFIAMELVDGDTLRRRLQSGAVPVGQAVDITIQVALALAAAHAKGIVHGDIKPENVMVRSDGYVKVLDFGLATPRADAVSGVSLGAFETIEAIHGGTPAYMAPEQIDGRPIDGRTDVFAAGILLCELVTGANPFARATMLDTLAAIGQTPRSLEAIAPPLRPELRRILTRMLAAKPEDRYHAMTDVAADLRELRRRIDVPAVSRPPRGQRLVAAGAVLAALATVAAWALRGRPVAAPPLAVQITHFSTAVRDPAVSPDGRLLVYVVQEAETPYSQLYAQSWPNGPPQQLTQTPDQKRWPAFSRDGSRVAYTVTGTARQWDTWVVPLVGGEPRLLLPNAAALQWLKDGRVMFSEFKRGSQLAVVVAGESRAGARDLYVPELDAMAHHSEVSPDGQRVAIGEMGSGHNTMSVLLDCFITGLDAGGGARAPIGSRDAPCAMFLRWSHDGRWIYFSSGQGNHFQVFRQLASGGAPEPITSGTGLAVLGVTSSFVLTPDDRTLIYPSGEGQEAVWLRRVAGRATQLTLEGNARNPAPSADGSRIFYISGPRYASGEIWMRAPDGSKGQQICPGFLAASVAPSPDGIHVAFTTPDSHQHFHLWLGTVDNSSAPREIAGGDVDVLTPMFDAGGDGLFAVERRTNGDTRIVRAAIADGRQRALTDWESGIALRSVSPDGRWISVVRGGFTPREAWIYPTGGDAAPRRLWKTWAFAWTASRRGFLLTSGGMVSRAWMLPNPGGDALPPNLGDDPTEATLERAGGRRVLTEYFFVEPTAMPDADGIVYGKVENHSNLYRLPLQQ